MELSVIIVNYNVRAFLEKCLVSVMQAMGQIDGEIIVVDNASKDDSVDVVRRKFPEVRLIASAENLGFARGNNLAIKQAKGEYILLLNPDTVVNEDTFSRCLAFMRSHDDAAAVGVKMVDGTGTWLPESKRGLPTPRAAFFKLSGLNTLFPSSNFFNGYYLGGLDRDQVHAVDVLTGAFMFIRRKVLDEVGLLDEEYFMYGEDIDLSYRMLKAGYHNYYLPETSIIHYKGESTRRHSFEYVRTFYRAMSIFVQKHYTGTQGVILRLFLQLGILMRAVLSGFRRALMALLLPASDALIIALTTVLVKHLWARWYFDDPLHFTTEFDRFNLPLYTVTWLAGLALFGSYDRGRSSKRIVGGVALGTFSILLIYSLLAEDLRSSRAIILIVAVAIGVVLSLWTVLINLLTPRSKSRRIIVAADAAEARRIMELLNRVSSDLTIAGYVSTSEEDRGEGRIGAIGNLDQLINAYQANEVIFSSDDLSFSQISKWMTKLGSNVHYKIASAQSDELTGSNSSKMAGHSYATEIEFAITDSLHRRNKRIVDVVTSLVFFLGSPVGVLFRSYRRLITSAGKVLSGSHTWVAYAPADQDVHELPALKPGIFSVLEAMRGGTFGQQEVHMINYLYAREYRVWRDVEMIFKSIAIQ